MRTDVLGLAALVALLAAPTTDLHAQVPLTVVAGPTLMTISSDEFETSSTLGFFVGAGASFSLNETVSVSPFLAYVQKGAEFSDGSIGSYDYIEVPVLFGISLPVGESDRSVQFSAGPEIGFQINCDEDGFDCTEFSDHKGTEFGLVASVGLTVNESLGVGGGTNIGLTDLFDGLNYKTRNFYLFLSIGASAGN